MIIRFWRILVFAQAKTTQKSTTGYNIDMAKTGKKAVKDQPRVRKLTRHQKKTVAKKKATAQRLPGSFCILGQAFKLFKQHWKILGGIMLVYMALNIIFASGLSNVISNFNNVKDNLGPGHNFSDSISGFGSLLGGGTSAGSDSASVLQSLLIVLESLVIIWALRNLMAKNKFSVKDAYYKSMSPLIPFLLVILVIIIQLLPVTLGAGLISLVSSAFANSGGITIILSIILLPLLGWSVYLLSGSIFALYIVTLPDMQPRQALRSAKKLVKFRRLKIIRRLLFLPIFILLAMAAVMLPLILFVHFLVVPIFYVLSTLVLLFVHTYFYSLYRGLLE